MDTQAPPAPETAPDAAANSEDAFDAVARKLDALLQSSGNATPPQPSPPSPPQPQAATADDHAASKPAIASTAAPETLAAPPGPAEDASMATVAPTQATDVTASDDAASASPTQTPGTPATQQADHEPEDKNEALPDLSASAEATPPADPPAQDAAPATQDETPDTPGLDPDSSDPSALDLDAEIEALLAEQPIDAEVLSAAQSIAQRDAEEAEQNKEALRLRAAEAAQLLEAIDEDTSPTEEDITSEIDSLLSAAEDTPIAPGTTSPEADPPAAQDPTIDQLDQMLAAEADDDDLDLDGAFFSTDAITTGDTDGEGETFDLGDGLTGSFTGDSSQGTTPDVFPVDRADTHPAPEPTGDEPIDLDPPIAWWRRIDWHHVMELAEELTRRVCWLINWPAQRFLTAEWRATVGYLALLQVAGAAAVWLFLVIL